MFASITNNYNIVVCLTEDNIIEWQKVLNVNDSPIITSISVTSFEASLGYVYTVIAEDIDEDNLIYGIENQSDPNIQLLNNSGVYTVEWNTNSISNDTFSASYTLKVSDGNLSVYQTNVLEVVQFVDCNGVNNGSATVDCLGDCNGDAVEDECNTCDSDPSNDCVQDCAAVWGGSAYYDQCGICDNDDANDCTQDCAGIWGGNTVLDDCNVCGGDNMSCADCAGTPNGND